MQLSDAPGKIVLPFANGGSKNAIPVTTTTPGAASLTAGFPPETMEDPSAGGIGPSGLDFNGIFNAATGVDRWMCAGAGFPFDATFATAVGGYPLGARVLRADGAGYWRSTVNSNTANPDTGGAGWALDVKAIASVYASAQQTLGTGSPKVLFDTVEFDSRSLWNAANKRFVAIYPGVHRLGGSVLLNAPAGQLLGIQVWKNGALAKTPFQIAQVADGINMSLPFDAMVNLAVGDYLEVYMYVQQTAVLAGIVGSNQPYVYAQLEYLGS